MRVRVRWGQGLGLVGVGGLGSDGVVVGPSLREVEAEGSERTVETLGVLALPEPQSLTVGADTAAWEGRETDFLPLTSPSPPQSTAG